MKTVLLFSIFLILMSISAYSFNITDNTKIIIKNNATEPEKYASRELAEYIKLITKKALEISEAESSDSIYVHATGDESGNDGVHIYTKNNNLYIEGNSPRATIYAVYEFLNKFCGAEFYTKDIEKIPQKKVLSFKNIDYSYTPPFISREAFYRINNAYPEYAVKMKLNGRHNYISDEMGGHIDLINWCHSTMGYMPSEKYYWDHPEYYALVKEKRISGGGSQLCWTNKEMQKELAKNVIAVLDTINNPKMIDVSQMDNTVYCECEECQKALEKYDSPAGALIECINFVAGEVKKKYPNVLVETLAYQHTLKAPVNIKAADNVIIRVCDIENNFSEPIADKSKNGPYTPVSGRLFGYIDYQTINKFFADNLEAWGNIANQIYVWDYTVNFANSHIPHPNIQVLQPNLQYFRDHKVVAMFEQGDYYNEGSSFNELKAFLIAKLLWNPDENIDKLKKDFCNAVYGKGAGNILKIIDIYTKSITGQPYYLPTYVYNTEWIENDDYIKCVKLFQLALKKTEKDAKSNEKIMTAYIDFLYGWYLKDENAWDELKEKCSLPWNDKYEYEVYFEKYCQEHGNGYISEGKPMQIEVKPTELKKNEPVPEICKDLKDEDWFEVNDRAFGVFSLSNPLDDEKASGKTGTLLYPTQTEWSLQLGLSGNIVDYRKKGKKSIDFYVVCRSINKHNDTGHAATFGIWDFDINGDRFKKDIPISELNDNEYKTIFLGTWEMTNCKDATFYMCGVKNPDCAEAFVLDRIIGIVK
ncbi:MAG: DUF4838 domain-containing protein [Armatimonadetes bacterium]|nr:DUF4838 domain-containing protein [Candidatus Hippobium faecium]